MIELCPNLCIVHIKKFSWHKSFTCPECPKLSLVFCSVYETCVERFLLHYGVAFCSPYIRGRKKTKRYSYFPYLCTELVQPRFPPPQAKCTQSCALCTRKDVSMNPEQLVQNVHRSASCAIGQLLLYYSGLCPYSTKAKNIVKSTVSVLFPSLCTKDLEPRWFAKLSNCEQSLALSTTNKVSANHYSNVQNVHYWAWNTVVLPLV